MLEVQDVQLYSSLPKTLSRSVEYSVLWLSRYKDLKICYTNGFYVIFIHRTWYKKYVCV